MTADPPRLRSSVFGKLAAIMLTMAVALLLLVSAFFVWILGPALSRSIEPLLADYFRGVAATAPDLATAERLSESVDIEIRYEGPAGAWTTSEALPSIGRARRDVGHRLLGSGHQLVAAPDGGTYLFDWSYRGKTVGAHYALLGLLLAVMGATFATTHLVIRRLLRPLRALGGGVERLSAGELEVELAEGPRDEFGALTRGFNQMVTRVREMIRARDRLLLDVSHELRSPLTRLRVAIELLPDELDRTPMAADVDEMDAMIAELLELERLREGGLRREAFDLVPVLRDLAQRCAADGPGVRLVDLPTTLSVEADAERIRTVLRNLLDNAVKFSLPDSRPVELAASVDGESVTVRVRDDGPGVPEDDRTRIFEPFYRADRARSKSPSGYGLGLAICRRIVDAHGGTLAVESSPGRGTTFVLTLPTPRWATGSTVPAPRGRT